jgi:hypothetical protein
MKRTPIFILILAALIGLAATTHDYFLVPESFFFHKGAKLDLHLLTGDTFVKQDEVKYQPAKTTRFMLYEGSKKTDLIKVAKEGAAPLISYPLLNPGQTLVELVLGTERNEMSRDRYADFLTGEGLDKLGEKVKSGSQFRIKEKYSRYLKTLLSVEDHDGSAYSKVLNEPYEIILKTNPYKKQFGEDMTALIKFQGKPAKGAIVMLYIKALSGNVYTQKLAAGADGEVSFSMSREGIYMLRSVHIEPTTDKDADFEGWWTSYTFPFSSSDELPNSYKEFGFGNAH